VPSHQLFAHASLWRKPLLPWAASVHTLVLRRRQCLPTQTCSCLSVHRVRFFISITSESSAAPFSTPRWRCCCPAFSWVCALSPLHPPMALAVRSKHFMVLLLCCLLLCVRSLTVVLAPLRSGCARNCSGRGRATSHLRHCQRARGCRGCCPQGEEPLRMVGSWRHVQDAVSPQGARGPIGCANRGVPHSRQGSEEGVVVVIARVVVAAVFVAVDTGCGRRQSHRQAKVVAVAWHSCAAFRWVALLSLRSLHAFSLALTLSLSLLAR
jgi:hypothetical protein